MASRSFQPSQGEDTFPESILTYRAHTAALTYPPATRVKYPDSLLQPLSQLQPDELSPKADSGVDRQQLITALGAYTAQRPPGENDPGPQYFLHSPSRASRPLLAPAASQRRPLPPGDPKDPPSMGDDMLLWSLLKDLQQQSEVPRLGPLELEEMADAIAGAMQGDHAGRPGWPRERGRGTTTRTGEWPGSSAPRSQTLRGG
ncbi:receptor-type tyrosine-protein phosphatase N2 [Nannospalax galili]|uniref:receptor-type tyrosine-protein phosphatase N2 n=1 Tax=Nannospalax galili TaxID=1026970 RepID=UPI0004ED0775|nr:receptor-type tyrosine-protein phosphatase N2 [Nannospalax galili]